jgi:hypothetical protein
LRLEIRGPRWLQADASALVFGLGGGVIVAYQGKRLDGGGFATVLGLKSLGQLAHSGVDGCTA